MKNQKLKPLDLTKLKNKQSKFISSKEALADVTPITWNEDVLTGKKRVIVGSIK